MILLLVGYEDAAFVLWPPDRINHIGKSIYVNPIWESGNKPNGWKKIVSFKCCWILSASILSKNFFFSLTCLWDESIDQASCAGPSRKFERTMGVSSLWQRLAWHWVAGWEPHPVAVDFSVTSPMASLTQLSPKFLLQRGFRSAAHPTSHNYI